MTAIVNRLFGWRWDFRRRWLHAGVDLSYVNGPYLLAGWIDHRTCWVALHWGNRGSDPVWYVAIEPLRLPLWLARRVGWPAVAGGRSPGSDLDGVAEHGSDGAGEWSLRHTPDDRAKAEKPGDTP